MSLPPATEFSLIIPTYNESENIAILIPKIISILSRIRIGFEIIIVDDNSPDLTWKLAKELFIHEPRVKIIHRFGSRDLSSAVLTGMGSATGKFLGVMDADFQHDETILPRMLKEIQNHDIVIGSRTSAEGSYGDFSSFRKFFSKAAIWLTRKIIRVNLSDPVSGFFIITKEVFESSSSQINPRGFKILMEFISRNRNLRISEIGYTFRERKHGQTKLSVHVVQHFLLSLLDIWFGNYFSLRFIKYSIVGVTGIFINLAGQWIGQDFLGWKMTGPVYTSYLVPSFAVAFGFELSVISNYSLNNVWTFYERKKKGLANVAGFLKFNAVSLAGFVIQIAVWRFVLGFFQHELPGFMPETVTYISNLPGIFAATAWNYYLNRNFTWSLEKNG